MTQVMNISQADIEYAWQQRDEYADRLQEIIVENQEKDDRIAELERLYKQKCDEVNLERRAKWQAESRIASIMEIARMPHTQYGPYTKLAMITAPEQKPYSAEIHGGSADIMLTSTKKWIEAMGCGESTLKRALEPLASTETIVREEVNLGDGKHHYKVEINHEHLQHPHLIALPEKERSHNGGDKRCPNCGKYCKRRVILTYECENCGIDYDSSMNIVDHSASFPLRVVPTPIQEPFKSGNLSDLSPIQEPQEPQWLQEQYSEPEQPQEEPIEVVAQRFIDELPAKEHAVLTLRDNDRLNLKHLSGRWPSEEEHKRLINAVNKFPYKLVTELLRNKEVAS